MKKINLPRLFKSILVVWVSLLAVVLTGCMGAPGETPAEVSRRHHRVIRVQMKEIQDDIDTFLLLDEPSRLSEHYVR